MCKELRANKPGNISNPDNSERGHQLFDLLLILFFPDEIFFWCLSVDLPVTFSRQVLCHRLKDSFLKGRVGVRVLLHSFNAPQVDIQEASLKATHRFKVEGEDGIALIDSGKEQSTVRGWDEEKLYKPLISF